MIGSSAPASPPRRPGMQGWDWVVLGALAVLAVAPLATIIFLTLRDGGVITGADGLLAVDQMQYLNWLRQSGEFGAAANLYDLAPGPRSFVHPGLLVSGLAYRMGAGVVLAYQLWKPIAVAALFFGSFYFAGRFLVRERDRRAAVVCALFFASPVAVAFDWAPLANGPSRVQVNFISSELWTGSYLWGYLFTAVAVGLLPLGLLAFERATRGGGLRYLVAAAVIGLLVSWLQPWQGATFILILCLACPLASLGCSRAETVRLGKMGITACSAAAAPLVYYWLLGRHDPSWHLAGAHNALARWPLWVTVAGLAPLGIPAVFTYRQRPRNLGDWILRAWPVAGLLVFYLPFGTFPFHAFQGLALPLAVLAVIGFRSWLGAREMPSLPAVALIAVLTVPGTLYKALAFHDAKAGGTQAYVIDPGDRDALRWIEAQGGAGGVLAPNIDGAYIPAYTGRETWTGTGSWTPDHGARALAAVGLVTGTLSPEDTLAVVERSGARFLFVACRNQAELQPTLKLVTTAPPRRFGCARVWELPEPPGGWAP